MSEHQVPVSTAACDAAEPVLATTQAWMQEALLRPWAVGLADVDAQFLPGAHASAAQLLGVYQRSYTLRLRECLREQFVATATALGPAVFDEMADAYLADCPSRSPSLHQLGQRFAQWMDATRPDAQLDLTERESWVDFMIDLAQYEYSLCELFDAPARDDGPWPSMASPDAALRLQPGVKLLQLRFPVAGYYHAVRAGQSPSPPPPLPCTLALVRKAFRVTTYPLQAAHWHFLSAMGEGASVESALQAVARWSGGSMFDTRRSWRIDVRALWIDAGFFELSDSLRPDS